MTAQLAAILGSTQCIWDEACASLPFLFPQVSLLSQLEIRVEQEFVRGPSLSHRLSLPVQVKDELNLGLLGRGASTSLEP